MKLNKYLGFIGVFLGAIPLLFAEIEVEDLSSEDIEEPAKQTPFKLDVWTDYMGGAKVRDDYYGGKLHHAVAIAQMSGVFYYCPAYTEGANAAITYTATRLRWHENPWFDQERFNTVSVAINGFSKRLCNWFWQGQIQANMDMDGSGGFDYMTYDMMLWGRYSYRENIGVHVGLIAQTGMHMDRVYPILGADWQMSRNWKLNLVFPVNVSLEYALNCHWSLALAGRSFDSRHRVGKCEGASKSVFRYENVGAEFAVKYEDRNMTANVHAGSTLGGRLRIANRHNHHSRRYHLDPTGYIGAEVAVKF